MEQVKNLDNKRVCDKSKDGKVIVIRKKDCITCAGRGVTPGAVPLS